MADTDAILESIEAQSKALAEKLFAQFSQQAIADTQDFLATSREDIERWTGELARGEIDEDDLESLIRAERDVAEMRALKQAGLAQVNIDTFTKGVLDIAVNAIVAAV